MTGNLSKSWSDLELEQYLLDELDEPVKTELRICLQTDQNLQDRYDLLKRSNEEVLNQYTPEYMSSQILLKQRSQQFGESKARLEIRLKKGSSTGWFNRLSYALPLALIAGFAFMFVFQQNDLSLNNSTGLVVDGIPLERKKGGEPALRVYRKTSQGQEQLKSGHSAQVGDVIQLQYVAAGNAYGLIFSIDGNGMLTPHMGRDGSAVKLVQGEAVSLSHAYELDNAPNFEIFYLITSESAFNISALGIEKQVALILNDPQYTIELSQQYLISTFELKKD